MKTHLSCSDWVNSFRINLVSTTLVCISIPLPCPALLPLSAFRSLCPALLRKMFKNRLREYAQKNSWPLPFFFIFFYSSLSRAFDSHNFNGKTPFRVEYTSANSRDAKRRQQRGREGEGPADPPKNGAAEATDL